MKIEDRLALYEKLVLKERRGTIGIFGAIYLFAMILAAIGIGEAGLIGNKTLPMQNTIQYLAYSISFSIFGVVVAILGIVWHFYSERTDRKWKDLYTEVTKDAGKD